MNATPNIVKLLYATEIWNKDDLIEVICAIDEKFGTVDFSCELIERLFTSLCKECAVDEARPLIDKLNKIYLRPKA